MKIDLHVHTKKIKGKDKSNRDIKASDFCNEMSKANVGIVAITNHNYFDFKQYYEIKSIINNGDEGQQLLLIPGIEIDIILHDKRKQINVLFSPEDINDFRKFYKNFENKFKLINNIKTDYKGINFDELEKYFLEKCYNNEIILCIDSKSISSVGTNNTTSFSQNDEDVYLSKLKAKNNFFIIKDTNSYKDYRFLIHHKKDCLIGSDNIEWKYYYEKSENLLDYNKLITNFSNLFSTFKNGESYETFEKMSICKKFNKIDIISNGKKSVHYVKNLKIIENSMNVIFGPKSSGKTDLLTSIYEIIDKKYTKHIYRSESGDEFLKNYNSNINHFSEVKNDFSNNFDKLLNYKEDRPNFPNFYDWAIQRKSTIFPMSELKLNSFKNNKEITHFIEEMIKKLNDALRKMNDKCYKDFFSNEIYNSLENIITYNIKIWINAKKQIFINTVNCKVQSGLSDIMKLFKNKITKPTEIGLCKKFHSRTELFHYIEKLNNFFNKEYSIKLKEYDIPTDGNNIKRIILKKELFFKFKCEPSSRYTKLISDLIKNYCYKKNFICPSETLKELDSILSEKKDSYHFIENKKNNENFIFLQNNNKINLSKGEKYYLNLISFFDKDVDYYFLDEPETSLNNNFISKTIYTKFIDLIKNNSKTFIITTHNSILGINTKSMNFIFRDNTNMEEDGNYQTLIGNIQQEYLLNTFTNEMTNIKINEKLLECFEGDEKKYDYRRDVYKVNRSA